jgi:hypothetical protein
LHVVRICILLAAVFILLWRRPFRARAFLESSCTIFSRGLPVQCSLPHPTSLTKLRPAVRQSTIFVSFNSITKNLDIDEIRSAWNGILITAVDVNPTSDFALMYSRTQLGRGRLGCA